MKMGAKRTIEAVKTVAQDRKYPRPVKVLTIAWHEDGKGKKTVPAINRTFRVAPYDKTCVYTDSQCVTHKFPLKAGELDFTSGMVCVKEEEYDEEGNLLAIHNLSHTMQYQPIMGKSNFREGRIAWNVKNSASSPNAVLSRYNPLAKKRAGILVQWQAQADSPDAGWLDGRCPTQEEVTAAQKEWEEKKAKGKLAKQTDAANPEEGEPVGVADGEGEDFDDFNHA